MKQKIFFFVLLLMGCTDSSDHSEEIVARLKSDGKSYYDELIANRKYDYLLDRIEAGDDLLIRNAYLLISWVDASTSTSLRYSLSRALIKNPDAVMNLVPEYFSVTDICTIPYIEAPMDMELKHVNASIGALERISDKKFSSSYLECLGIYKKLSEGKGARLNW